MKNIILVLIILLLLLAGCSNVLNQSTINGIEESAEISSDYLTEESLQISDDYSLIRENGRYIYVNAEGNVKFEIEDFGQWINPFEDGVAKVTYTREDMLGLSITHLDIKALLAHDYGLMGYIDEDGIYIVPLKFIQMPDSDWSENGTQIVREAEGDALWGVINRQGEYVIEPQFEYLEGAGRIKTVVKNSKYGFITENGEVLSECIYDDAGTFTPDTDQNGAYIIDDIPFATYIKKNNQYGIISNSGEILIEPILNYMYASNNSGDSKEEFIVYPIFIKALTLDEMNSERFNEFQGFVGLHDLPYISLVQEKTIDRNNNPIDDKNILIYYDPYSESENKFKKYSVIPIDGITSNESISITFENTGVIDSLHPYCGYTFKNAEQGDNGQWYLTYEYPPIEVFKYLEE